MWKRGCSRSGWGDVHMCPFVSSDCSAHCMEGISFHSHPPTAATPQLQQTQPALHDHLSGPGIVPPGRQVTPDCVFLALAALITVLAAPSKAPPNHMLKCPWEESRFHTHGAMTQAFLVKQVIRRQYVLHLGEKKACFKNCILSLTTDFHWLIIVRVQLSCGTWFGSFQ